MSSSLPTWSVAASLLLLLVGFEVFVFGVMVLIPSAMFADGIAGLVGGVTLPRAAMLSSRVIGFSVYTLLRQRQRAWMPILVFAAVATIIFNSSVEPFALMIGVLAEGFADAIVDVAGGYSALVSVLVYAIVTSWLTRALERSKASLLVSAAVATLFSQGISIMTLTLFANVFEQLKEVPDIALTAVVLLTSIALLRDAKEAITKWDPSLLAQLPLVFIITSAFFPDIARIIAVLAFALAVFGAGGGLALRSRRLLVTASVIIGAFAPLAAT